MTSRQSQTPSGSRTERKKSVWKKLAEDDFQEVFFSFVRLGVLAWSGALLTFSFVDFPFLKQKQGDPTFVASIFTAALTTFGVNVNSTRKSSSKLPTPEDVDKLMARLERAERKAKEAEAKPNAKRTPRPSPPSEP